MEQKKAPKADIEQRRTTGFLLGLIFVLSLFYVAMEWNSVPQQDGIDPLDLSDLMHESELVPMSNEETVTQLQEKQQVEKAEQLHIVDDEVELQHPDETLEGEGDDDETLLADLQKEEDDKALAENMLRFMKSEEKKTMGTRARLWYEQHFAQDRFMDELERELKSAALKGRSRDNG